MKDPKKLIPDDRALLYLRGCNPYQFVDRITKIVRDCIDQIQEFFNVLETIHDGKDGKDGDTPYIKDNYWYIGDINTNILAKGETGPAGPMGPIGPTGPIGPSGPEGPKGLTGEKGDKGPQGPAGQDGHDGVNGVDGADGADGADGVTPHINSSNKHWMIGDEDTGVVAEGQNGRDGTNGTNGTNGTDGITPHIDSTTGNWFIGDQDTGVHAQGPQGEPGTTPDISGKEDVTPIVAQSTAISTLTAEVGKYYRLDVAVETLAITLPTMTGVTNVKTITFYMTGGTTPGVTFTSTHNVYLADFTIESGKTYEVNAAWNGASWIVAAVNIVISNP